jgi:hypothetical protein
MGVHSIHLICFVFERACQDVGHDVVFFFKLSLFLLYIQALIFKKAIFREFF